MAADPGLAALNESGKYGGMCLSACGYIRNRDAAFRALRLGTCYSQETSFGLNEQVIGFARRVWAGATIAANIADD